MKTGGESMDKRGFTLLELLMVVIIIAILASIALPQYIKATEKARASEALQLLGAIRASQNRFKAGSATAAYAATLAELDAEMPATANYWTLPPSVNATSAQFTRPAGQYSAQVLGIVYANGALCGNFVPLNPGAACP